MFGREIWNALTGIKKQVSDDVLEKFSGRIKVLIKFLEGLLLLGVHSISEKCAMCKKYYLF